MAEGHLQERLVEKESLMPASFRRWREKDAIVKFLHYDFHLNAGDGVKVTLDKQANVRLLDDNNFSKYKRGRRHKYYGGQATKSPVILRAPRSGHWNLVIDLGGYWGTVRASVATIRG